MKLIDPLAILVRDNLPENSEVNKICSVVFDNICFSRCSGSVSPNKHHYGHGGLKQHTFEVVSLCVQNAETFERWGYSISREILLASAVFHDFGKIWDYQMVGENKWEATPHKRTINHLCRSAVEWSKAVERLNLCRGIHDDVLHCILAHHADYGSPVLPKTREAWILHLCDNLSARVNDCDRLDLSKRL